MSDERLEIVVESEASQATAEMDKLIEQFDKMGSQLDKLTSALQGSNKSISNNVKNIGKTVQSESQNMVKSLAKISATVYALKKTFSGLAGAIKSAMDYQETVHLFSTVFTRLGKKAGEDFYDGFFDRLNEFQGKFIRLGLDPDELMNYQAMFAQMSDSMGVLPETAYAISESFTALGADLSALFNLPLEESMRKLQAGLSGQIRPLRELGIDISKTTLMEEARMRGIDKSIEKMTASEKVQLRYLAIMRQTMVAHGDMANTIMSPANSLRVLTQQFKMAARAIGSIFLPMIQKLLPYLTAVAIVLQRIAGFIAGLFGYELPKLQETVTFDYDDGGGIVGDWDDEQKKIGKTGKALKKLKGQLMGFDEVNVLKDPDDNSSSGGGRGGIGGGGAGFDLSDEILKMNEEYQKMIDEILANTTYTAEEIADNITNALLKIKDASEPTIESLKRLHKALEPLKSFIARGLLDFYHEFLVPVGLWTLGEGLPRLIDALSNGLEKIKWEIINDGLVRLWQSLAPFAINVGEGLVWFWENALVPLGVWTMNEVVPRFLELMATALDFLNIVIEGFKPYGEWLWNSFLVPLAQWTGGKILEVFDRLIERLDKMADWAREHPELVNGIITVVGGLILAFKAQETAVNLVNKVTDLSKATFKGFGKVLDFIKSPIGLTVIAIAGLVTVGWLVYDNWDKISKWFKELWEDLQKLAERIWDNIKKNIIEPMQESWDFLVETWESIKLFLFETWNDLWDKVSEIWENIGGFIGETWDNIKTKTSEIWTIVKDFLIDTIWQPILDFIDRTFVQGFKTGFETAGKIVDNFKTNVDKAIGGVKKIFEGILKFIKGVFTKDWGKAWEGVVQIFETIVSGLGNIFKFPLNIMIDGINAFLRGLNKIKIPDWVPGVGGKGFHIPEIPRLATGGILNAGQLFIANEAGPELVGNYGKKTAVLNNDQIVDAVSTGVYKAVSSAMAINSVGQSDNNGEIIMNIEGTTIARVILPELNNEAARLGYEPILRTE